MAFSGTYFDGRTACGTPVRAEAEGAVLVLYDAAGGALARWSLAEVHYVARPGPGQPVRLRCGFADDARLTLDPGADLGELKARCLHLDRRAPVGRRWWKWGIAGGLGAAVSVVLLIWVVIPFLAGALANTVPLSVERDLGRRMAGDIADLVADGERSFCTRAEGLAALNRLTERLLGALDDSPAIRVRVVDSKMVNAFALPGGQILIMRGLLDFAESGDEVAGVLAHEMGHVIHRHPTALVFERAGLAAIFGLLFGDVTGGAMLGAIGQAAVGASYGREAEREADAASLRIMNAAGLDAGALAVFLGRLRDEKGEIPKTLRYFASHPSFEERVAAAQTPAKNTVPVLTPGEWATLKGICRN